MAALIITVLVLALVVAVVIIAGFTCASRLYRARRRLEVNEVTRLAENRLANIQLAAIRQMIEAARRAQGPRP